ncbi:MAG: hypothetical protein AB1629_03125 [Candidatus Omnitrophota bacterium]
MNFKSILIITCLFLIYSIINIEPLKAENSIIEKPTKEKSTKEEEKIQKAIDFLLTTNVRFQGGTTLIIKKLNEVCNDKRLDKLWREKIEEDIPVDMKILYRVYNPTPEPLNIIELEKATEMDKILIKAHYCQNFSFKDILHDIGQIKRDGGVVSSHLLFYLAIMKKKGCYSNEPLAPLIQTLVNELVAIQNKMEDISIISKDSEAMLAYAERALFIGFAGYPVKKVWIENILNCQSQDGSWFGDTHTTAVCLWAIVQKRGFCK